MYNSTITYRKYPYNIVHRTFLLFSLDIFYKPFYVAHSSLDIWELFFVSSVWTIANISLKEPLYRLYVNTHIHLRCVDGNTQKNSFTYLLVLQILLLINQWLWQVGIMNIQSQIIVCVCVCMSYLCVWVWTHKIGTHCIHIEVRAQTILRSWFSSTCMWVLGIKFRSSLLCGKLFACWTISPAWANNFRLYQQKLSGTNPT